MRASLHSHWERSNLPCPLLPPRHVLPPQHVLPPRHVLPHRHVIPACYTSPACYVLTLDEGPFWVASDGISLCLQVVFLWWLVLLSVFSCLLVTCLSCLDKCAFMFFAHFLNWIICFSAFWFKVMVDSGYKTLVRNSLGTFSRSCSLCIHRDGDFFYCVAGILFLRPD